MSTKEPIDRFERIEAEIIVLTDRVATIENKKILWIEAAEKVAQAAGRQPGETLSEAVCRVTKERDEAAQKVTAAREKHVKLVAELERLTAERNEIVEWAAKLVKALPPRTDLQTKRNQDRNGLIDTMPAAVRERLKR